MENASKALIMAGGMLIAILLVSLFLYAWGLFSEYQSSQDSLAEIEDTAKFNEQFTAYDRNDVMGYEIISLTNKVIDYNFRMSSAEEAQNSKQYLPITLTFSLGSNSNKADIINKFAMDGNNMKLFGNKTTVKFNYVQSKAKNEISELQENILKIESETNFGNADAAMKVAKSAGSIFISDISEEANRRHISEDAVKIEAIKAYNSNVPSTSQITNYDGTGLNSAYDKLMQKKVMVDRYWEFLQFKKAIFKCTDITYDNVTGRVSTISFEWTGKIK